MCCRGLENVEFMRDKFASEHWAGPAGESGTVKQVRRHDLGRCARQTECPWWYWRDLSACVCLWTWRVSGRAAGREEDGVGLLISLRAVNLMTPNDTIMTVSNILNTVKKFGISKYQCEDVLWSTWYRRIIKLPKLSTLESISCYFELSCWEVLAVTKHSR